MVTISGFGRCRSKTICNKLHEPLAEAKPTSMKAEDWALLDRQAMGAVRLSLAKNIAYNVVNEKTTYGLFKALSNMYEKPSASNKVFLIRQLVNTKMKEGASVADHVNEFNTILSRLMSVDIKFDDEVQALLLLSSLLESWSGTVTVVSGSTGSTKLKFDNIRDLILGENIRMKTSREYSNSLLSAEDKGRGRKQDRGQKQNRSRSKSKKRCQDKEVNMAAGDYDDALVCCVENTIDDRIMDSGASFHATYFKEELERFKLHSGKVRLADDKTLDIAGIGDVVLKTSFGTSWTLKDVRGNAALWHQRLGHMSEKGMKILTLKGRIPDLQKVVVGFCEPCVLGKQKKVSFVKFRNTRKLQRLELVHTDVYGPTSVASIGGSRYYVTFIDDSSRKVWVYFLKNKSEVFNTFKKWKAVVENETNLWVKCLKSDNGGEYSSREFIEYCAENGIRMLKTVPETPQQNGVAERMNRTLNERAKSMRLHAGLPKMFWEDSVTTVAYLINHGPSVPLGFQILEEEWQGKEVSLVHLRVFGCDSYVKVKDVARDKVDAKSVKCTFIGYGSDEMRYRFWDSKSHKVVRSRDVTFNEDSLYGAKVATYSSNLTKPNQKDKVVLEDSPENLANKSIVTEHGLSSEITQSPGGSSDMSEGSKNSGSFKDSGRSDEEDSKDRASSKKGGSKTPQLQRSTRESRASVRLPAGKKALQSKWVFRVKEEQDGKKSCEDDYNQPARKEENLVCKLKKSLYGLKQPPRQWYLKFNSFMQRAGYKRYDMDHCCYLKKVGSCSIILLLYVDDMLVAGSDMAEIKKFKRQLSQEFKVKDLGPAKQILGMSIIRDKTKGTLRLSQEKYIGKVLEKFNMKDAEARHQPLGDHFKLSKKQAPKTEASRRRMAKVPYASAVGSMMYAMVCTRPDIAHAVGVVSRFMSNPGREHWEVVKWLLCYLKGTSNATLYFSRKEVVLEGFSDSDYGGCLDLGKSTKGYVFRRSLRLVRYMAIVKAGKELVWLNNFLEELDRAQTECVLFCDNQSAIHLAKNSKILRAKNPADMQTKVVTTEKLKLCAASTGFRDN
ncbi:retrovirus-related pol polyprotein from transposon TNT 1-94 [Tanacetum coccineum]